MQRLFIACMLLALSLAPGATLAAQDEPSASGTFVPAGTLVEARHWHTATALADGRVLIVGGIPAYDDDSMDEPKLLASAEVWDPATGTFSPTGSLAVQRLGHRATLLPDGRVLVVGGLNNEDYYLASAEVWDPATGTFSLTGSLAVERVVHSVTGLSDGRVLVVGGHNEDGVLAAAEIWDPAAGTFSPTGSLAEARQEHTASPLADGRVLVVGGTGDGSGGAGSLTSAEIWDPATDTFSPTGSRAAERRHHRATVLPDGRVLMVGGWNDQDLPDAFAEVWDTATGMFSPTGSLAEERVKHTATVLPDGRVLVVGGAGDDYRTLASAEVWDVVTGTFSPTGSLAQERVDHTATALPDGRVLVVGGTNEYRTIEYRPLASAEVWEPGDE